MQDRDFQINGTNYKLSKIDAFKQFHIVRRLAPLLGELAPVLSKAAAKAKNLENASEAEKLDAFAELATPLMNGLSKLSDTDADKVLFGLLASVERQQKEAGNWARLATDSALMFSDMDLPTMLQVAGRAFMFNLSGFFSVLPRVS